jgi:hypothetical protein
MIGGAVFAGAPGGGGGGGDENGGVEPIGVNGGVRVGQVVGVVPTPTRDGGAFGFLTFTQRWARV